MDAKWNRNKETFYISKWKKLIFFMRAEKQQMINDQENNMYMGLH